MPCHSTFSLGFVICWFHANLSPPHFTTKLRPWAQQGFWEENTNFQNDVTSVKQSGVVGANAGGRPFFAF